MSEEKAFLEGRGGGDSSVPGAGDELRVEEEVADGEVGEDGFEELGDLEEFG